MRSGAPSWLPSQVGAMLLRSSPAASSNHFTTLSLTRLLSLHKHRPGNAFCANRLLLNRTHRRLISRQRSTCYGCERSRFRFSRPWYNQNFLTGPASIASHGFETLSSNGDRQPDVMITPSELQEVLQGVAAATQVPEHALKPISDMLLSCETALNVAKLTSGVSEGRSLSYLQWSAAIKSVAARDSQSRQLANLTLAVAFLRRKSRCGHSVTAKELASVWDHIHAALDSPLLRDSMPGPSRSAQGFLAVPLCSLVRSGNIDVLFRLHVWLPDGQRGAPGFAIHSHQPFARSWVLAGEGRDIAYKVDPVTTQELATHAEYALTWTDGKDKVPDNRYKNHQIYSKIVNTGRWVSAVVANQEVHTRNMSYCVPAASFHSTEVPPDEVHATLFLFDSASGFVKDAPVLGPVDSESSIQVRNSGGVDVTALSDLTNAIRKFEDCMAHGSRLVKHRRWDQAFEAFQEALQFCQSVPETLDMARYKKSLTDHLGTAATAFCTEISTQSYDHLQALAKLGANIEVLGEQRYSALDSTASIDKLLAGQTVLKTLKPQTYAANQISSERSAEASLQQQYRELFRNTIQPILEYGDRCRIHDVRHAYALNLAKNEANGRAFDKLKYVGYSDLLAFGGFPRLSDGLTHTLDDNESPHIVFFSYRWVNKDPWTTSPDSTERTLYPRVIKAVEEFLNFHPEIDRDSLGVWIDVACINQDDPMPGISALPMIVAQCNTLISLVDDGYHDRAWCSVEVMMNLALSRRCRLYMWYEYREDPVTADGNANPGVYGLRTGPEHLDVELARKHLSFEGDRPKVLFLEGLSRLLS